MKGRNRQGRETRKTKKPKPAAKSNDHVEHIPGKAITQSKPRH